MVLSNPNGGKEQEQTTNHTEVITVPAYSLVF